MEVAGYTKINLKEAEDLAPKFGLSPNLQSRFARVALELEKGGVSYFKAAPNFRIPFGHRHTEQEEVYVLVNGAARMKLAEEIVELRPWDAVRVSGEVTRGLEAGPEGAEYLVFGAPNTENRDAVPVPNWWVG